MSTKKMVKVTCKTKQNKPSVVEQFINQKYQSTLLSPKTPDHCKTNSLSINIQHKENQDLINTPIKANNFNLTNLKHTAKSSKSVQSPLHPDQKYPIDINKIKVNKPQKAAWAKVSQTSVKKSFEQTKATSLNQSNSKNGNVLNKCNDRIEKWIEDFKLKKNHPNSQSYVNINSNMNNKCKTEQNIIRNSRTKKNWNIWNNLDNINNINSNTINTKNTNNNTNNKSSKTINKNTSKSTKQFIANISNKQTSITKRDVKPNVSEDKFMKQQSTLHNYIASGSTCKKKDKIKENICINTNLFSNYRKHRRQDSKDKVSHLLYESEKEIIYLKQSFWKYFTSITTQKNIPEISNIGEKGTLSPKNLNQQKEFQKIKISQKSEILPKRKQKDNEKHQYNKPVIIQNVQNLTLSLQNQPSSHSQVQSLRNKSISKLPSSNKNMNIYLSSSLHWSKYITNYLENYKSYPWTNLSFYKYGRQIGRGSYGKVNLGLNILSGRIVAIKSFNKSINYDSEKAKIISEAKLMKNINHPSIVKLWEIFESENFTLIIMEYINGGNWYTFVKKRKRLTESTTKLLFKQIIHGIKYLQGKKIVHRDIKLENILLDINNTVKICDFGIAKKLKNDDDLLYEQCGTPSYMAPEIWRCNSDWNSELKNDGYSGYSADMWSCGVALYVMLGGVMPFNHNDKEKNNDNDNKLDLKDNILNTEPKDIEGISDEARDLIKGWLNKDPCKRFTCDEVLNHEWLKGFKMNAKNNSGVNKYSLFTKAEIAMWSKNYIDYKYAKPEELQEMFTISNLINYDTDKSQNELTRSQLLSPYNSMNTEYNYNTSGWEIHNNIIEFSDKTKEKNVEYELNNNEEFDNGIIINPNYDIEDNEGTFSGRNKDNEEESIIKQITINEQLGVEEVNEGVKDIDESVVKKMEVFGYKQDYVKNCLNKGIMCHASAVYFLMKKYEFLDLEKK